MPIESGKAMEILERTPATVSTLLRGLSPEWLPASAGPGTFSPVDVLCHLIAGEETDWITRTTIILEHGEAQPFEPFDRHGGDRHKQKPLAELLETFASARRANLDYLETIPLDRSLTLKGMHPDLGSVTLGQLLAAWVVHDLGHIAQIVRVMSRQYTEATGPWRQYLSILG